MNKKAQGLSVTTLVVIVLAIIVLVVLALGFTAGWTNLWSNIQGYFSPVNVDTIKQACQFACTTQATYDYCCRVRDVKFVKGEDPKLMTCEDTRIKPADCDISCDVKVQCKELLCKTDNIVKKADGCGGQEANSAKKFSQSGEVIPFGSVCCEPKA